MDMNFPPLAGLNVQPKCKLHCEVWLFISRRKIRSDKRASFHCRAVILLFKNAETPGAFLRHQVGGQDLEAAGWEVVSLDIVLKFKPTILCNIRSWDYTTFPRHFNMVWGPHLHGIQPRATTRPRRLLEGNALVLSALEIIAHFNPLMWVIENPATSRFRPYPVMISAFSCGATSTAPLPQAFGGKSADTTPSAF